MHIYRKFWFNFFSESNAPFWTLKFDENERYYWNGWSAKLHWNRSTEFLWNFVVMKDIICRYAFLQEMLIWSFWGAIYIPFYVWLPVTNAWNCNSLYTAFSSNVGVWGTWACSLFNLTLDILNSFMISEPSPWLLSMYFYWQNYRINRCLYNQCIFLLLEMFCTQ